jgi:hypothetical protein
VIVYFPVSLAVQLLTRFLNRGVTKLFPMNSRMTRIGLGELVHTRHAGLRKMLMMAGVRDNEVPTSDQIAFRVAPRINAAGRVGDPNEALQMLNAVDPDRQVELARSLDCLNRERRSREKEALEELLPMVPSDVPKGLVIYGPHWKKGIAGILASRVRESHRARSAHRFRLARGVQGLMHSSKAQSNSSRKRLVLLTSSSDKLCSLQTLRQSGRFALADCMDHTCHYLSVLDERIGDYPPTAGFI